MHWRKRTKLRGSALWVVIGLVCLASAASVSAASRTHVSVDFGWSAHWRLGRWTPIWITMSDATPRGVTVELFAPHDSAAAMILHQQMTIGPSPHTYVLYAPLITQFEETVVTVRDDRSGRSLVDPIPLMPQGSFNTAGVWIGSGGLFVGSSGRAPAMGFLNDYPGVCASGFVVPNRLPQVAIGYDSLDLLVLNSIDLAQLSPPQQQAIVDWVRAGGTLLMWPASGPLPNDLTANPLLPLLPCEFGQTSIVKLDADQARQAKIDPQAKTVRLRQLTGGVDSRALHFLGIANAGMTAQRGLGRIGVLGFDPTELPIAPGGEADFWTPLLAQIAISLPDEEQRKNMNAYQEDNQFITAKGHLLDLLGNVPGTGEFGFTYVLVGLLAMMLIVGPVDWLVLRWLGRQPWTWVTTTGWIVLITTGSLYAGHAFKSGDLYFRSLRLIDQAGDHTVATHEMFGIYAPRTTDYDVSTPVRTWWQPVNITGNYYGGGQILSEIPFLQAPRPGESDANENAPQGIPINIWSLRFLQGETVETGPAAISARIWRSGQIIHATITNQTNSPLTAFYVRSSDGMAFMKTDSATELAPGATAAYSGTLAQARNWTNARNWQDQSMRYQPPGERKLEFTDTELTIANAVVSGRNNDGIYNRPDNDVCLYAFSDKAVPATLIQAKGAIQKHYLVIRALISLSQASDEH